MTMNNQNSTDTPTVLMKLVYVWTAVGFSQMTPLQWVQFFAGIFAIVYSAVQTWVLVRDRIVSDKP